MRRFHQLATPLVFLNMLFMTACSKTPSNDITTKIIHPDSLQNPFVGHYIGALTNITSKRMVIFLKMNGKRISTGLTTT